MTPTPHRFLTALIAAAAVLATAGPALAFNCSVPEKPGGPIPLRAAPDHNAKVVAMMRPGGHIRWIRDGKPAGERDNWALVRWTSGEDEKHRVVRGWALRSQTHGGECED